MGWRCGGPRGGWGELGPGELRGLGLREKQRVVVGGGGEGEGKGSRVAAEGGEKELL